MRILHVIDTLDFGGAEKVMVALANGFAAADEVSVCCVSHSGVLARELHPGVTVFSLGRGAGNEYGLPWRLAQRIRAGAFDVVHTHNWGVFLEGGFAAWLARVPVRIHTVHGPYLPYGAGWVQRGKRALRNMLERWVARGFKRVVAVSGSIGEYIPKTIGIDARRVVTVHNGIAGDAVPHTAGTGTLTFITVGRLDAIKNHDLMLRAFRQSLDHRVDARLVIVGDGPQRAALEMLVDELGLRPHVELTGFRTDIAQLLDRADVFLLSSRYEGISIALLEAMRAGLPAVATNVGGIPETILHQRTGLLVANDDANAYAQALRTLADSPALRRDYGRAAQKLQQTEFSLDGMLAHYAELYAPSRARP